MVPGKMFILIMHMYALLLLLWFIGNAPSKQQQYCWLEHVYRFDKLLSLCQLFCLRPGIRHWLFAVQILLLPSQLEQYLRLLLG